MEPADLTFRLNEAVYIEMKAHALFEAPRECCGMLAGAPNMPLLLWRTSNVSMEPERNYRVDADDQLWVMQQIVDRGLELAAIYHSHPTSGPFPSIEDVRHAYPGVVHLILGMHKGLQTRAWWIEDGRVIDVALELV